MKKLFVILLAAIALCFAGCGGTAEEKAEPTAAPTEAPTPTPEPTPIPFSEAALGEADYRTAESFTDIYNVVTALSPRTADAPAAGEQKTGLTVSASADAVSESCSVKGNTAVSEGEYLYVLSDQLVRILRTDGINTVQLSTIYAGMDWTDEKTENGVTLRGGEKRPQSIIVSGSRLAVISDRYGYDNTGDALRYSEYAAVDIYDVSDPTNPVLLASLGQDGYPMALYRSGSRISVVSEFTCDAEAEETETARFIPDLYTADGEQPLETGKITIPSVGAFSGMAVVALYDMESCSIVDAAALCLSDGNAVITEKSVSFFLPCMAEAFSRVSAEGEEYAEIAATELYTFSTDGALSLASTTRLPGTVSLDRTGKADGVLYAVTDTCGRYYRSGTDGKRDYISDPVRGSALLSFRADGGEQKLLDTLPDGGSIQWVSILRDKAIVESSGGAAYEVGLTDLQIGAETESFSEQPGEIRAVGERYLLFACPETGELVAEVRDRNGALLSTQTFGSDFSGTLESCESYLTEEAHSLVGFAADDSYCLYTLDGDGKLQYLTSAFLSDWAWRTRAFIKGEFLYLANTEELTVYDLTQQLFVFHISFGTNSGDWAANQLSSSVFAQ